MSAVKKKVVVGVSGGVDSSVAAYLLKEQGYEVIGLFMNNWDDADDEVCTATEDWQDARAVCGALGIPAYSVNFQKEYFERVFTHFLSEYKKGRTPNPDVLCNREIKFGPFWDYARRLGAEYIATGHYCRIAQNGEEVHLLEAADASKDQTYFLNQVRTQQLKGVLFPLGDLVKTEVRAIAEKIGLVTAKKKDSTGVCFIGERNFKKFLSTYLPAQRGDIVDTHGKIIGTHDGLMYYTIGQRRGLGIGGVKGEAQSRWYVVRKELETNRLIVSCGEGEELLYSSLRCDGFNFIGEAPKENPLACAVKTRYRMPAESATLTVTESGAQIVFERPQRAVTPGQYAVAYRNGRCLGGGVIQNAFLEKRPLY